MAVVRVSLAVVLAVALLGVGLTAAERAERDRNAAVATGELRSIAERAERLAADNDPVPPGEAPAGTTLVVDPPRPWFTDGGRLRVADDRLVWRPERGRNRSVDAGVPLRVEAPIVLTDRRRLRLAYVRTDEGPVVRVQQAKVQEGSRDQTPRVRGTARLGDGL